MLLTGPADTLHAMSFVLLYAVVRFLLDAMLTHREFSASPRH